MFFCLSGFLICQSLRKNKNWALFFSARFLRIFPNLTFALVITSAITLLWYQNYPHIWLHVKYVIQNILMFIWGVNFTIPGVFDDAYSPIINAPLWTLPSELWLYLSLFLLFILAGRRSSIAIVLCAFYLSIIWGAEPIIGDNPSGTVLVAKIIEHPLSFNSLLSGAMLTIRAIIHFLPLGNGFFFARLGSFFMAGDAGNILALH